MRRKSNTIPKLHIKKGDKVKVITGNDKGKTGEVREIFPEERRIVVDGVNVRIKHTKPTAKNTTGGRIETEMSIDISNVMVLDKSGNPTRVGRDKNKSGKLVRIAKTTGGEI